MPQRFRILLTRDFYDDSAVLKFRDIGLDLLSDRARLDVGCFAEHRPEISADQVADAQGVIVLTPRVTAASLARNDHLLAIGRFGVGYDSVDVDACTRADVVAFITAGAVDRSVAEATLTWMLALTHQVRVKDQLVRAGQWQERTKYMGCELRERTLGIVGLGGIGRALIELTRGFGMNPPLAFDPFIDPQRAQQMGVQLVSLEELLSRADFVSLHCPLNDKTRNLLGKRELALMKPTAYLLNTARGGIVNEDALYEVLKARRIAGAAVDCFEHEPLVGPHRFGKLDNVLLAPHSIAWTDEMFRDIGRAVCQGMLDLSQGNKPHGVLNPQVFDSPRFREKWAKYRAV